MDIIIKIAQVLLALSILVLVHEFGHFIFARIFKIRVEKFYLFFNPGFTPFKYKPKNSDTEYGIGWLPLGGYCKIAGMVDESMDKESMSKPPQPWEYRSKPAWQRLLVIAGGVLFNFIFACLIYSAILFTWGEDYIKNEDAIYGIAVNDLSHEMGFREGDRILYFNDYAPTNFLELQPDFAREQTQRATVLRGGDTVTITIDPALLPASLNTPGMFGLAAPFIIKEVPDTSINYNSGIMPGDLVTGINSQNITSLQAIQRELANLKDTTISIEITRNGEIYDFNLNTDNQGRLQVYIENDIMALFTITQNRYSFFRSIPAGFAKTFDVIGKYIKELGLIFSPKTEAYKSVGSFIAIGQIFPSAWDWEIFWQITAMLSVMLAVINLLPIPALDGGHIVFVIYEMITGKKPSDKFMEIAQLIGMILIFALIFLAFGNDIRRLFN